MKAVILCAGYGTRLKELTNNIPKPMLPICGRPLLEYIILHLKSHGISEIAINLHFNSEIIREYFSDGSKFGMSIKYSYEKKLLGTAGALLPLKEWLGEEDFIVQYGDIITNQDLHPIIKQHQTTQAIITLLLHQRKASNSFIEMDKRRVITKFIERPEAPIKPLGWVNSALQILTPKIFDLIEKNRPIDLPRDIYAHQYQKCKIMGFPLTGFRVAIDSKERYHQAISAVEAGILNGI
jgi:NDP-sugar pyrophosphorylase family protein